MSLLLIGNESTSAERVRRLRENKKLALQCNTNVQKCNTNVQKCNTELEIEKELEKELEKFSDKLKTKIKEWLKYKSERNEGYKSTGLKNLLLEIQERSKELSEDDIEYVINLSMSNGWKGIIWSEIKRKYSNNQYLNKSQEEFKDLERFYTT